jgi:Adenylate and Guanylate cyclase catalytic domain
MARERVERRLAAILAADVAGYSRQTGEDEEGTLARLKAHRRELIDPMVAKHHGRIVKTTGDGLLIEFVSMVEAVACALAVQRAMVERNAATPEERRITFRVDVHLGDVIVEDADIHGDGVNIAARLEGIAEPGGVGISEDAFRQVRGKIDAECVVATIEPELYAAEHFRSQRKPPESLDAWECVIRALSCAGQFTRTGWQEAEVLCRRAIAIAPNYGQAHSLLAWVVTRRTSRSGGDVIAVLPEAMAEAQTALGLDERDSWAHMARGMVLWRMRRHGDAERTFRRALEFNPNFALAHALIGLPLAAQGAHEEAIRRAEHARAEPERSAYRRLRLTCHAGCSFRRGALCGLRGLGAQDNREIPREPSRPLFSRRGECHVGGSGSGGRGAGGLDAPAAGFLADMVEREHGMGRRGRRAPPRGPAQGRSAAGMTRLAE